MLTKLPCWADLSDEEYRDRVAEIVRRVETEAAEKRALEGKSCLGVAKTLAQDPLKAPKKSAKSSRPWFHASSKKAREAMREAFKALFDAFLLASAEFLEGKMEVVFPDGSFPPAKPFFAGARAGPGHRRLRGPVEGLIDPQPSQCPASSIACRAELRLRGPDRSISRPSTA